MKPTSAVFRAAFRMVAFCAKSREYHGSCLHVESVAENGRRYLISTRYRPQIDGLYLVNIIIIYQSVPQRWRENNKDVSSSPLEPCEVARMVTNPAGGIGKHVARGSVRIGLPASYRVGSAVNVYCALRAHGHLSMFGVVGGTWQI